MSSVLSETVDCYITALDDAMDKLNRCPHDVCFYNILLHLSVCLSVCLYMQICLYTLICVSDAFVIYLFYFVNICVHLCTYMYMYMFSYIIYN